MRADVTKLVRPRKTRKYCPIAHVHVPGQGRVVGHDCLAANDAVVRDMHVRHNPVVVTENRLTLVLGGTAADRAKFADRIPVTDRERGRLVRILLVLRIVSHRRKLINMIIVANLCGPVDHDVAVDACTATNLDIIADYRKSPNLDIVGDRGFI